MRAPLSWIDEFTPLVEGSTLDDVHAALVRVGLEEEDLHDFEVSGPVVVGEVLEFVEEPQKNGKTIRWCQVRVAPEGAEAADGGPDVRGIVCGARNFLVGDKVVVTLPGSVLPGDFAIAARKTYGHVSDGMIASVKELALGDEHDGILRLVTMGLDPEVGTDAIALLGLDDSAVEVNVTPDRGYAFSIRGIAREYSHATGRPFTDPASLVPPVEASGFPVVIDDVAPIRGRVGARGFVTRSVRGVDATRPTPPWMRSRLTLAGVRSISLLVDITNYVMFELGQPIHGYDLDRLAGGITVRRATPGETLETLDGQVRTLSTEDLLITDESGAIGLAGVMGGGTTEMGLETTNVLIEAATFDPVSIARTARRHKLPSEASRRFERGVDPAVAVAAANRVVQLMVQLAGGTADTLGSDLVADASAEPIALPAGFTAGLIGVDYEPSQIRGALELIGASVEDAADGWTVTPPSWRPDLTDRWTLAEEIARIDGYDRIPSVLPVAPPQRGLTRAQQLRRGASNALAATGFTEVMAYPFLTEAVNQRFGSPDGARIGQVKLANALDASVPYLRTSLLPGLIEVARRNRSRGFTDLALFETGSVFRPELGRAYGTATIPAGGVLPGDGDLDDLAASIPPQPRRVGVLLTGDRTPKQPGVAPVPAGIADALEAVRSVARAVGAELEVRQGAHQAMHPGRTAELVVGDEVVGYAGELLPELADDSDLPRVVGVAEVDLDALIASSEGVIEARGLSTYPAATQDLSLVVDAGAPAAEVGAAVREGAGELLEHLDLVDDYRGTGVAEGRKSLTFALRFRASDRTLTAAEATAAKLAGSALAGERFGATIRE
ncbi:phenylalanine--tRNA ligase subunit beta [Agromyces sp. SYSU T00194]|uniref:phenylalanine--tRNA ligase subunit beta n=1 Tax=Agromyces chitinivorans TaxID=3158560 RepID=UPI003399CA9C